MSVIRPPDPETVDDQLAVAANRLDLPPGVGLRAYRPGDFVDCFRMMVTEPWPMKAPFGRQLRTAFANSFPVIVACRDGRIVGFVRAISDGAYTIFVGELMVAKPFRSRGIGRALLEACGILCPHERIELMANRHSATYYRRIGFFPLAGYRRMR